MMPWLASFTLADLITLTLQTALVLAVGLHLPNWLRIQNPRWRSRFWYCLLLLSVALPIGRIWQSPPIVLGADIVVVAENLWVGTTTEDINRVLPLMPLGVIWLAGMLARLSWLGFGSIALTRWRRRGQPLDGDAAILHAHGCTGVAETPFLSSSDISTPVTFGLWSPVVLVPTNFDQLDDTSRQAVACHELIHVRRHDAWRLFGEETLRAILWFHPAVWWLLPRIQLCREQIVDRAVIEHLAPRPYLRAMCHYAVGTPSWSPTPALSLFQPRHLRQRVAALTQEVSMSKKRAISTLTVLCGLLASTAIAALTFFPWSNTYGGEEKVYLVEGDVVAPVRSYSPAPAYPEGIAKEDRLEGKVVIKAKIDPQGLIVGMEVVESLLKPYDQAAMEAIGQWRFEPATLNGNPVYVYYTLTINFRLK